MSNIKTNFIDFLSQIKNAKEVSLVLAQDESEKYNLEKLLLENNFSKVIDVFDLMKKIEIGGECFFVLDLTADIKILKKYYDFVIQYPTRQIEIFDANKNISLVVSPNVNSKVILLIDKEAIQNCQKQNFDFLSLVGLTYQS